MAAGLGAAAASSPVAELQAALTALLVERSYVIAAATRAVAAAGGQIGDAPAVGALEALESVSGRLAQVLVDSYPGAAGPVLEALHQDDRLSAGHAVALADGTAGVAGAARSELDRGQRDLAQVLRQVVPGLDAAEVTEALSGQVQAQLAVGRVDEYSRLRAAAREAAALAGLLAAGIAQDRGLGPAGTSAARLRADLTGLLTEHASLAGALPRELRAPGPAAADARQALQANAVALADLLGEAYPALRAAFLRSWTVHLGRLEAYAAARAAGGAGVAQDGPVRGYPTELARLLAEHVRGLPAGTAVVELEPALSSLVGAVDAEAAAEPGAPEALRQAAQDVLPVAALLSAAVAEDLQLG
ncbi:MAG: hypothetical protein WD794_01075 [Mycobacteriales bacterium]